MGAAARPVRTKRPSRRAAEAAAAAAGGQIPSPSTKRPGRSANAADEIQVPAVVRRARVMAKKETSGSHPLRLDPCSNRGGKRAGSKQQPVLPDAKRARSNDLICPSRSADLADDGLIVDPRPRDNNNWANLDDGPAGLIADQLLAFDVADYLRFRAVCRSWRQSSTEPRSRSGLDRRFHPWRWTMLLEELAAPDRRSFLNTSTGQCVQVDIPELRDHALLALTPEGLLVLLHKPPRRTVRLLNPLTRQLTDLPPLTTLLPPIPKLSHYYIDTYCRAWGSGIASDDSTVVLCLHQLCMLGMAKPGDDHWTLLNYKDHGIIVAPLMFAGRFYCVNLKDGVMVLEMGADQPPHLKLAAKLSMRVTPMTDRVQLLNNSGELMLVHRRCGLQPAGNKLVRSYNTYRVDMDTGALFPAKSLGGSAGRAVFLGRHCSLSVSLDIFHSGSLTADTVYLDFDVCDRRQFQVGEYHLMGGSVERISRNRGGLMPRPHTLFNCLSLSYALKE